MSTDWTIKYSNGDVIEGGKNLLGTKIKATRLCPRKQSITILNGGVPWADRNKWVSREGTKYETWGWLPWRLL